MKHEHKQIGLLMIGQSPRPDLAGSLRESLPDHEIIEAGALDGLTREQLPNEPDARYPLMTKLRDGSQVIVEEQALTPLLQEAVRRLERDDVIACLLACAGPFESLEATVPLFRPFRLAVTALRSLGIQRLGVLCPAEVQRVPSHSKWTGAGFDAEVWAPPPGMSHQPPLEWVLGQAHAAAGIECIVLDYFGYPTPYASTIGQAAGVPVLDVGLFAVQALANTIRPTPQ